MHEHRVPRSTADDIARAVPLPTSTSVREPAGSDPTVEAGPLPEVAIALMADGRLVALDPTSGSMLHDYGTLDFYGRIRELVSMESGGLLVSVDDPPWRQNVLGGPPCGTSIVSVNLPGGSLGESGRYGSELVMASDSSAGLWRPCDEPDEGPWNSSNDGTEFDGELDVRVVLTAPEGTIAPVWVDDGGQIWWTRDSRAMTRAESLGPGEPLVGSWPELVVRNAEGIIEILDLLESSRYVTGVEGEVVAVRAGNLLVLSDDGVLSVAVGAGGPRPLAEGVADAIWGAWHVEDSLQWMHPDNSTVTALHVSAAPGDTFAPPPVEGFDGTFRPKAADGREAMLERTFTPDVRYRVPWAYRTGLEPLEAGHHDLIWDPVFGDPADVGDVDVTRPGEMPPPTPRQQDALEILRHDGVGPVPFGSSWIEARDALVPILGQPFGTPDYDGMASWLTHDGILELRFDPPDETGALQAWLFAGGGDWSCCAPLVSITMESGLSVGTTIADVIAAYPDVGFRAADPSSPTDLSGWTASGGLILGQFDADLDQPDATLTCLSASLVELGLCSAVATPPTR